MIFVIVSQLSAPENQFEHQKVLYNTAENLQERLEVHKEYLRLYSRKDYYNQATQDFHLKLSAHLLMIASANSNQEQLKNKIQLLKTVAENLLTSLNSYKSDATKSAKVTASISFKYLERACNETLDQK